MPRLIPLLLLIPLAGCAAPPSPPVAVAPLPPSPVTPDPTLNWTPTPRPRPKGQKFAPDVAPDPGQQAASATDSAPTTGPNSSVNDSLNLADQLFKTGADGCTWVGAAVASANAQGVSSEQRAEVARYAQRCNLRF